MKELVTQGQAETVLRVAAIVAPTAGAVIGVVIGTLRRRAPAGLAWGFGAGLAGTAIFGLWRMHVWFGERYGCASVKCLAAQLAIFLVLGIAAGLGVQSISRKRYRPEPEAGPTTTFARRSESPKPRAEG